MRAQIVGTTLEVPHASPKLGRGSPMPCFPRHFSACLTYERLAKVVVVVRVHNIPLSWPYSQVAM